MATTQPITMDTLITVRVLIDGSNRRFKIPLMDLKAEVFEKKLRTLLSIPANQGLKLERYSDSLASYVELDSSNPQVYKTLFRAAKAKLKLKVKATPISNEENDVPVVQKPQATTSTTTLVNTEQVHFPEAKPVQEKAANPEQPETTEKEAPVPRPFEASTQSWGKVGSLSKLPHRAKNPAIVSPSMCSWSVYCNQCDKPMANEHLHCDICDGGDFDLCASCVEAGHHCKDEDHWLIKRFIQHGRVVNSTSETVPYKSKVNASKPAPVMEKAPEPVFTEKKVEVHEPEIPTRTCNSCIKVHPEHEFVTCKNCEDYDLCIPCHLEAKHGHHPGHTFQAATSKSNIGALAEFLCTPGRNVRHAAVCDGCDKYIYGVRHKCLNCPDWDFCTKCIKNSKFIHPGHRFVPVYDPLPETRNVNIRHAGIYCDGPLCKDKDTQEYMAGVRYKCAVCHDTDFCANCEASPANRHNRTHPLIMFKSPVRNVSVTTMGEDKHGATMATMGDQIQKRSTSTETVPVASVNAATQVQTIADLKPSEATPVKEPTTTQDLLFEPIQEKIKVEDLLSTPVPASVETKPETPTVPNFGSSELRAYFVRDTVMDGTKVLPGAMFTQVWTLKNPGPQVWPKGCSVRYVGGDNMLNVDDSHPSSTAEINEATESNVVGRAITSGEEVSFRVLMKAPKREGTAISYWRLKDAEGIPFGHRLWCHIDVTNQVVSPATTPKAPVEEVAGRQHETTHDLMRKLMDEQNRKRAQMAAQTSTTTANKTLDAALKRHAEVRAQVIENMRRAADRVNAELERMGSPKEQPKPESKPTFKPIAEAPMQRAVDAAAARAAAAAVAPKASVESEPESEAEPETRSQMIFPTLEKESPVSSTIATASDSGVPVPVQGPLSPISVRSDVDFFEDAETVDYEDSEDEDGFATDEEYDILDASDQELA